MKFAASARGVISGLMLASCDVYAQEAAQDTHLPAESAIQKPYDVDSREQLLRDAEALMKAGRPAEAYDLLEPLEFERSGEVRFDYLIGIAALDSGKPDKATLAFERVLAVDPDYTGARLDMARAYYLLGDMPRAKIEFETVLKQNPTEAARTTIQRYLDKIASQDYWIKTRISGYVEVMAGHDTNVNNASETPDNIVTPTLNPTNGEIPDNYLGVGAGGEIDHALNANWRLFAGANLNQHTYYRQKDYDSLNLDERFGIIYGTQYDLFRFGVSGGQSTLGNLSYRNTTGLNAEWRHATGSSNQTSVFIQYIQYRYAEVVDQVNDVNQQIAGTGWLHVLGNAKSTLSGSLYFGTENDVGPATQVNPNGGRTDGAKRLIGFRVGGQTIYRENIKLYFSAGEQFSKFDEVDPAIESYRTDRLDDLTLGTNWYLDSLWTVRLQLTRFINMSNVDTYSYDRSDYSLTLRRNFK
jgi:outer membrane protein